MVHEKRNMLLKLAKTKDLEHKKTTYINLRIEAVEKNYSNGERYIRKVSQ